MGGENDSYSVQRFSITLKKKKKEGEAQNVPKT